MEMFQNKYRIPPARAKWWDYSKNGTYFVTICTKERGHYFGKIKKNEMVLSEIGVIAKTCWQAMPIHFPLIQCDAFVIMPNHMHGILKIDLLNSAQTDLSDIKTEYSMKSISPESCSLGAIIRSYKSAVTKEARLMNSHFSWQTRFHDHIIRNNESYYKIQEYIINNPATWESDTFFDA